MKNERKAPSPHASFLRATYDEHDAINRSSDVVCVTPVMLAGQSFPSRYLVTLTGVEHFVRREDGTVDVTDHVVRAEVGFPDDYLRSTDAHLGFRVVRITSPMFHPNLAGPPTAGARAPAVSSEVLAATSGIVCLGTSFRPGTRLRALVFQLYRIVAGKDFATDSPLDGEASRYFVANVERVRSLQAPPLWKQPISRRVDDGANGASDPCGTRAAKAQP